MNYFSLKVLELIRDGKSLSEIENDAKSMLGEKVVQTGIDKMLCEVCVEGTFKDGVKTIRILNPICSDYGNLELALYGSFLPVPNKEAFEVRRILFLKVFKILITISYLEIKI